MELWGDDKAAVLPTQANARDLLNQQIWCWGRDIECVAGNLLVKHGFRRVEKPAGISASSLYRLDLSPTSRIVLRGFGVFLGDDRWGGMFLPRFKFRPQMAPGPELSRAPWSIDDLPQLAAPSIDQMTSCQQLLLTLIDWIRRYEVWVVERAGVAYRSEMLTAWSPKHGAEIPAEEMASAWRLLGVAVSDYPEQFIACLDNN